MNINQEIQPAEDDNARFQARYEFALGDRLQHLSPSEYITVQGFINSFLNRVTHPAIAQSIQSDLVFRVLEKVRSFDDVKDVLEPYFNTLEEANTFDGTGVIKLERQEIIIDP